LLSIYIAISHNSTTSIIIRYTVLELFTAVLLPRDMSQKTRSRPTHDTARRYDVLQQAAVSQSSFPILASVGVIRRAH